MNPTLRFAVRLAVVLVSAAVLQVGVLSPVPVGGARPVLLLAVSVTAGVVFGSGRGAVVGFAAGLVFDLVTTLPLGLSALVFCVAGQATGRFRMPGGRAPTGWSRWWRAAAVVGAASAVAYVALAGAVWLLVGRPAAPAEVVTRALVVGVVNAVLTPVTVVVLGWVGAAEQRLDVGVPGAR